MGIANNLDQQLTTDLEIVKQAYDSRLSALANNYKSKLYLGASALLLTLNGANFYYANHNSDYTIGEKAINVSALLSCAGAVSVYFQSRNLACSQDNHADTLMAQLQEPQPPQSTEQA